MSARAAAAPAPQAPSTRDAILDAPQRCFAGRGVAGVSTRAIAAGAGGPAQARHGPLPSDLRLLRRCGAARGDRRGGSADTCRGRPPAPLFEGRSRPASRRGARPLRRCAMRLADIDLSNPDLFAAGPPHEAFKVLRREAPLFWNGNGHGNRDGFWALTRYRDIWNVSLDPKTFSTARRGTILRDWTEEEFASNQTLMINMDPPRHTKYRRLVNLGFSPKLTNRLELHMREITNRLLDNVAARGECDFVTDVAAELPLQVIVELMGVPIEDRHKVFEWSNTMIGFDDTVYGAGSNEAGKVAAAEIYMYANQLAG